MSTEAVAQFLALLKDDQQVLERLRPVADPDEFDRLAAELAGERGLEFTPAEFRAAISEALSRQPAELTEEELQGVAGGAALGGIVIQLQSLGCLSAVCSVPPQTAFASAGCTGGFIVGRQS